MCLLAWSLQQICEYDWSKQAEYDAVIREHEATAPSYADINLRLAEARAALGVEAAAAATPVDDAFAAAAATETDAAPKHPRKNRINNNFAARAPEDVPVGNAPFDKVSFSLASK